MPLSFDQIFSQKEVKRGQLLLSEPFLPDPNFSRKVILLCEHDDQEGTYGLVLNELTSYSLSDALETDLTDYPVYLGGPVEPDTLHYVHNLPNVPEATYIKDGLYYGGNLQKLLAYLSAKEGFARFFIGYSGWGKQQLAAEMRQGSWMVSSLHLGKTLEMPTDELWKAVLTEMGGWYRAVSNSPIDPSLN